MKKLLLCMGIFWGLLVGCWVLGVENCCADVPGKINFQGKLTNAQGQLLDGQYNMTFKLYDVPTGGSYKWTEDHSNVRVTKGLLNVVLGSTLSLTSIFQQYNSLYLEVAIAGEAPLSPRQEITSVGYALNVADEVKIPRGVIVMWSGTLDAIPSGWALCDGTNGAPNLKNKFIRGVDAGELPGATGGANSYNLTVAQLPAHSHTGTTDNAGSHQHGYDSITVQAGSGQSVLSSYSPPQDNIDWYCKAAGAHSHTVTVGSTGSGAPIDNCPEYYKLAYIMKL